MSKLVLGAAAGAAVIAVLFWILTIPATVTPADLPPYTPNVTNGQMMFHVGGCASCHATPNSDAKKRDDTRLGGGVALSSPFGTFFVPNISPDPADGIGAWSEADFVTALWKGTSRRGRHLFPAFPYTSYQQMQLTDVRDLFAYLKTLPQVSGRARRHDLAFPFNVRRLVGVWKLLFFHGGPFVPDATKTVQLNRGAYLVNGPGHCAECHSPRNFLGAILDSQRFAGGPSPDGKGWVPNITPAGLQHQDPAWSQGDIASFLGDGMSPSGDFVGGAMADVIRNLEQIDRADRDAIAAYIYALPAREGPPRPAKRPQKP
ncbi:MAG TPA: cytochrome c [Xanthobacteraceae bacterium]|jgi:mono/diheme cytochrome c family protein